MHLFSRKLRLFSLLVCSSLLTALSVPQVISAAPSPGKLGGIKEIVASPGFWGGSSFAVGTDGNVWSWGVMLLVNLLMVPPGLRGGRLLPIK